MKSFSALRFVLSITVVIVATPPQTRAVTGPNAVATNGYPWVVQLSFGNMSGGFTGTGSYITNGVVLTCAHNVDAGQFNTFTMAGQTYFALGVADPLYAGTNYDGNDIGLWLVLNRPAAPGGTFPSLVSTSDAPLTTGSTIKVLGYGQSGMGGLPIYGTMTMTNDARTLAITGANGVGGLPGGSPHHNVTADTYTFVQPPSSELTDPGDSGGPYIANIGGVDKIVAVHTSGFSNTVTSTKVGALGVRVDAHLDFVTGNGQNVGAGVYQSALVRLGGTGNTTWSTAASWLRSATNFNAIPQITDIAILDPTTATDTGTTVTLDANTANLNGLLNDVTLKADGFALNVTGRSGALNGGFIDVGGAGASALNINYSLDNEGTVTIRANGTANLGGSFGSVSNTTALRNGTAATFAVTGGVLNVAKAVENNGTFNVNTAGVALLGNNLPLFYTNIAGTVTNFFPTTALLNGTNGRVTVADGALGTSTALENRGAFTIRSNGFVVLGGQLPNLLPDGANPTAVYNYSNSTLSVEAGGFLYVTNNNRTTITQNRNSTSAISVNGGAAGTAVMVADQVDNYGKVEVKNDAILDLSSLIYNEVPGQFKISGGANGNATGDVFRLFNWGNVNVSTGGVLVSDALINNLGTMDVFGGTVITTNFNLNFATNVPADIVGSSLVDTTGRVTFAGGRIIITNAVTDAALRINTGTFTMNGGHLSVDRLFAANGSNSVFELNGGTVTSRFTSVLNNRDFYVGSNSVPATLVLIDSFHTFSNSLNLAVTPNATGTVFFGGFELNVTNGATRVGSAGVGQMTVSNGTFAARDLVVAVTNGASGSFVQNSGTTTIAQTLSIGSQSGATGSVLMTGGQLGVVATSTVFSVFIGDAGSGRMVVSNGVALLGGTVTTVANTNGSSGLLHVAGGTVTVNSLNVGTFFGATGAVLVTAGELVATNGTAGFGLQGTGSLSITGGVARFSNILVANSAGADGTISVSGGTLSLSTFMVAGDGPNTKGAVWVTGGTLAAPDALVIISRSGPATMAVSNGTATIGNLTVASNFGGDGSLTVAGGTLTIRSALHVSDDLVATGSVLVTGGTMTVTNGSTLVGNFGSGQLTISNSIVRTRDVTIAVRLGSSGTLTLNNGTLVTTSLFNNTNGVVRGIGTIAGPVTSAGTITPGFSAGKLFITTNLTLQSTSVVVMELGGTADADYDQINVAGDLAADGTLNVLLINGFNPTVGNTFDIFDFANSSGEFSVTNLPALFAGLSWDTSQLMTLGEISVVAIPEPATVALVLGSGVLLLAARRRRLRKD